MNPAVIINSSTVTANSSNAPALLSSHGITPARRCIRVGDDSPNKTETKPNPISCLGYEEAIRSCEENSDGIRLAATLWQALIREHEMQGNNVAALRASERWVRSLDARRHLNIDDLLVVANLVRGSFNFKLESFEQALDAYRAALTVAESGNAGNVALYEAKKEYATLLCYFGKFDEALPHLGSFDSNAHSEVLRSEASLLALYGLCRFAEGGRAHERSGLLHLLEALQIENGDSSRQENDRCETMRLLFSIRDNLRETNKLKELEVLMNFLSPRRRAEISSKPD